MVCEDDEQLAKIVAIREQIPNVRTIIVMDPPAHSEEAGSAPRIASIAPVTLDQVRQRGRSHSIEELEARRAAVQPRGPVHVHLHLRHHRPAQGLRAQPRQLPRDHRHDPRRR